VTPKLYDRQPIPVQTRGRLYFVCSVYTNICLDACNAQGSRQTGRGMWCTAVPKRVVDTMNCISYEGWNFNSGNYLFTTDTK